jgi:hypothetical protein
VKYVEKASGVYRDYHPDYFRLIATVRAYEALNMTAFIFLGGIMVLVLCGFTMPMLMPLVAMAVGLAYVGYGILAAVRSAEALEWPVWLMVVLHLVTTPVLILNAILLVILVVTMKRSLREFGVTPGVLSVPESELMVLQKMMVRYR